MLPRLFLLLGLGLTAALAQSTQPQSPASASPSQPGQCYALLVGGLAGGAQYSRWYADWLTRFQTYLTKEAHVPAGNVMVLSDKAATMAAITAALGKFAQHAQPQDQLILFMVGHGENKGDAPRFTLAGPDPTPPQLAALLNAFPAKNQVVLNFSASSGDFLKTLSAPGRVNIAATSPTEIEEPVFPEFFLRGLESKRADADKNGTITLLEAFNWAAQQTPMWIARWVQTSQPTDTESSTWQASGRETIEIFEKLYAGSPTRQLDPASDRTAVDADIPFAPPGGDVTDDWASRRVIDEHALLEDCGQGIGVGEMGEKDFQPILGKQPGDPGYLAGHTVLGQPGPSHP